MNNGNIFNLKWNMNIQDFIWSTVIAIIIGVLYYINMSLSIPKESNCSFSANIWTDIIAIIFGFVLMKKAIEYNDILLNIIGVAIITEHILQFYYNKTDDLDINFSS